ncbi:hypothetical protein [Streptomyces sp. NPDC012510]|uniref:DUF7779 domain-containing protein n=1 Tax=Streptomyces sp. NPDC012510 TaxID=3364838 RepID=UPI0036EDD16B
MTLGMGRRQLAIEYVHRFRADYDLVWWVPAVTRNLAATALARLARRPDCPRRPGLPWTDGVDAAAQRALGVLQTGSPYGRWLVVYDDATDPDALAGLLPSGPGRTLLTARDAKWEKLGHPLVPERMGPKESAELLLGRVPSLDPVAADDLATALGEVPPLALDQAGGWLAGAGAENAVGKYLAGLMLGEKGREAGGTGPDASEGPARFAEAALRKSSPAAHRLLQLCCRFAPLSLSLTAIRSGAALDTLRSYDASLVDVSRLDGLVAELTRLCLAEIDTAGDSLRVHRLVQRVVMAELAPEERETALPDLYGILNAAAAGQEDPL